MLLGFSSVIGHKKRRLIRIWIAAHVSMRLQEAPELASFRVHAFVTRFEQCAEPTLLDEYALLLSSAERDTLHRLVHERDRRSYLTSRALLRTVLGQFTKIDPGALVFDFGPYGKPFLVSRLESGHRLAFNLSHTDGLAIVCVALDREVGVDVENASRRTPFGLAQQVFAEPEFVELTSCPESCRAERFWALWTLKESYLKATGLGLYAPLDSFSFALDRPGNQLSFSPRVSDSARRWWFGQWRLFAHLNIAAICVEQVDHNEPQVSFYGCVPLRATWPVEGEFIRGSGSCEKAKK